MTAAIVIVCALVGFAIFFFIVKRLVRMAVRVALFGALIFALIVGAIAWWWYAPLQNYSPPQNSNRSPQQSAPQRPARK